MTTAAAIAFVVAVADNGVIGRDGALPWHLPDDLKHFKAVTLGKPVLMGRRTFASIGRPLPGRRNLVMSREEAGSPVAGIEWVRNLEAACELVAGAQELCVIGGAQVYALTLPLATRIYLTRVHAVLAGDVYFPLTSWSGWRELARIEHPADARHAQAMSFIRLERDGVALAAGEPARSGYGESGSNPAGSRPALISTVKQAQAVALTSKPAL